MRQALLIGMAVLLLMPEASMAADGLNANGTHYIFLTSSTYKGDLGGLSGADDLCSSHAANGTLTAPLGLTWKALISIHGVVNARDRVTWVGPVYDVAGNLVTNYPNTWPWVQDGTSEIDVDENGDPPPNSYVWTGSNLNGESVGPNNDCNVWTDNTGTYSGWSGETGYFGFSSAWIDSFSNQCDDDWFSLYCVSEYEEPIFSDGFESGDTTLWSNTVP